VLNTREEILVIRSRVAAGEQPWQAGFDKLAQRRQAYRDWRPQPVRVYTGFPHWFHPGPSRNLVLDNESVYANALLFAMTGDTVHAGKAAEIIGAWAGALERIETLPTDRHEEVLATSYSWPAFVWAASLLDMFRASYDREAFRSLLRRLIEPVVRQTIHRNNWLSWSVCCRMAMALYLEDAGWFAETQGQFHEHLRGYLGNLRGELKRDLWHAQMGLAPLIAAGEMAWHRGVDLYGAEDDLLYRALEYQIPFFLGETRGWPFEKPPVYEHMRAEDGLPKLWPMYEMAAHHYVDRRGLPAPQLRRAVAKTRPEGGERLGWGTLTHPLAGMVSTSSV
jgi:hypothetical protein